MQKIFILLCVILFSFSSLLTTFRNNDWRDLTTLYGDAAEKSPNKARAVSNYGMALGKSGRCEEAIPVLQKAIDLSRPHYEAQINSAANMTACLSDMGKNEEAIKTGEKLLKEMSTELNLVNLAKYMATLGSLHIKVGDYETAYQYFLNALRFPTPGPKNFLVFRLKYLLEKVYDDPAVIPEISLNKTGNKEVDINLELSKTLLEVKEYEYAERILSSLAATDPENSYVKELQERLDKEKAKNLAEANQFSIERHSLYHDDFTYRMYMSISRFILKYYKPLSGLAGRVLSRANTMYPEDPFVILKLASWLISQGKTDLALEVVEKGITIQPDFVPLLDLAGKVYRANMMVEKEIMTYKKILELYPGHPQWFNYENKLNRYERKQTQPGKAGKNLT